MLDSLKTTDKEQKKTSEIKIKHDSYNLIDPVFIADADVELSPRMYRVWSYSKKECQWLLKTLKQRNVFGLDDSGKIIVHFPHFKNELPGLSLVVFRYVGFIDRFKRSFVSPKVFMDVYSALPSQGDELFYKPGSGFENTRHTELFNNMKRLNVSNIGFLEEDAVRDSCSVRIVFPYVNMSMLDGFIRSMIERFGNAAYSMEALIEEYHKNNYPKMDTRILQAEEIIVCPESFTTEKIVVRGRVNKSQDDVSKGMPIRIKYENDYAVFETIEANILDQMRFLCDNRQCCKVCEKRFCMERGTVCSWHVRKIKRRGSFVCRIIFPGESFFRIVSKMIYFSSGSAEL